MMPYVAMHALGPGESPCASVCVNVWWGIGAVCSVNGALHCRQCRRRIRSIGYRYRLSAASLLR